MRLTLSLIFCLLSSMITAQDITAILHPNSYERHEDMSVNLDIPYKNGIVKAYLKSRAFNRTVKLRKITSNGVESNELDIDFGTEKYLSLIGFFSIDNQPVIFYCLNRPQESDSYFPVTIKAAILDWETLKVVKKKELKTFQPQPNSARNFEFSNFFDFEQRGHVIKAKRSAEADKYVLFFDDRGERRPARKYHLWVFDKDLNQLNDEQEVIEEKNVKIVDFGVSNNNFYLIYQTGESCISQGPDHLVEAYYCGRFSTIVRKTNLSNSSSVDMPFENAPGFIKMCRLLFNKKNKAVRIGGLYSKNWDTYVSGSFCAYPDDKNNKILVSSSNDFPSEGYLASQFNSYEERNDDEKEEEKKESKCERCKYKLTSFFAETNEHNRSDLVFETGYGSFLRYGLIIIVTITPAGEIKNNFLLKPQKLPNLKSTSYSAGGSFFSTGAYACYYNRQLLLFYNDNLLNGAQGALPKMLYFNKKTNWGLFQSTVDESGSLFGKKLLIDNSQDKYFSEVTQTWRDNNNNLYFPASSVKSGYDEFRLGVIRIK